MTAHTHVPSNSAAPALSQQEEEQLLKAVYHPSVSRRLQVRTFVSIFLGEEIRHVWLFLSNRIVSPSQPVSPSNRIDYKLVFDCHSCMQVVIDSKGGPSVLGFEPPRALSNASSRSPSHWLSSSLLASATGGIVACNAAATALTGYTLTDFQSPSNAMCGKPRTEATQADCDPYVTQHRT